MVDRGTNAALGDGTTLEVGEMVNPATGGMGAYEEVWRDVDSGGDRGLFVRRVDGTAWQGRVGEWQLGMGRDGTGFWAWQAKREGLGEWEIVHGSGVGLVNYLPDKWAGDKDWIVLES